jgi:HD-GYP domain-containing protein (c-di-GMP phosphodiesterase class II)
MMQNAKRILVVDDEVANLNVLRDTLAGSFPDFELDCVSTKEEAFKLISERDLPFEVIVTDMRFDHNNQTEATGGIKIIEHAKKVDQLAQVVVVTSYETFNGVCEALEAGASFYLPRSMVVQMLPSAVRKAIDQRKAILLLNDFILCFAAAIDAKDAYTSGHSFRVREYSLAIGDRIPEITPERRNDLSMAALLHDIGKVGISNCLLHKPGKYTEYERSMMNEHPTIGKRILEETRNLPEVLKGIEDHHTHYWDYENEKPNQGLSLFGKIIAIADTFDAMTTNRAYRAKMSPEIAVKEIEDCSRGMISSSGKRLGQFDPSIVSAFLKAYNEIKDVHDRLADKEFSFKLFRARDVASSQSS